MTSQNIDIEDLPELSPEHFDPYRDSLIVQKIDGATYFEKASNVLNNESNGLKWLPSAELMITRTTSLGGINTHEITDLVGEDDPHSLLISVYHIGRAYPHSSFSYYTGPSGPHEHLVKINSSRTDQDLQEMFFVPIVNKTMYYGMSLNGTVNIFAHAYIS